MNNLFKYLYLFVIAIIVTYSILDTDKSITINHVKTEVETTTTLENMIPEIQELTTNTLARVPIIENIKIISLSELTSSSVNSFYNYSKDAKTEIAKIVEMFINIKIEKINNKNTDTAKTRKSRNVLIVFGFNNCPACRILHRHLDRLDLSGYNYNYVDIEETDLQTYRGGKFKNLNSFPVMIIESKKGNTLLKKVGYSEDGYKNLKSSLKRFSM